MRIAIRVAGGVAKMRKKGKGKKGEHPMIDRQSIVAWLLIGKKAR